MPDVYSAYVYAVEFSEKELNYLERALHGDVRELMALAQVGNIPHLLSFQKRLLRKVEMLRRPQRLCTRWGAKKVADIRKRAAKEASR